MVTIRQLMDFLRIFHFTLKSIVLCAILFIDLVTVCHIISGKTANVVQKHSP